MKKAKIFGIVICSILIILILIGIIFHFVRTNKASAETPNIRAAQNNTMYLPFWDGVTILDNNQIWTIQSADPTYKQSQLTLMYLTSDANSPYIARLKTMGINLDVAIVSVVEGVGSYYPSMTGTLSNMTSAFWTTYIAGPGNVTTTNKYAGSYTWTRYEALTMRQPEVLQCTMKLEIQFGPPAYRIYLDFDIVDIGYDYNIVGTLSYVFTLGVVTSNRPAVIAAPGIGVFGSAQGASVGGEVSYINPNTTAFQTGYDNGYNAGYEAGDQDGYRRGWSTGFDQGVEAGYQTAGGGGGVSTALQTASAVVRVVWSIVDVPILGPTFTLGTLLGIVVIFSLVMFIVKIIRG